MRILVVDNYDSFVYNLVQYLGQLGVECEIWRNDDEYLAGAGAEVDSVRLESVLATFDGVLLSPGPGIPENAGVTIPAITICARLGIPVLGVCLGHQAIGVAFGAVVDRAPELMHGKTSIVSHSGDGVLKGLSNPFTATRYHSLTVVPESIPDELVPNGHTESGLVMAMHHRSLPVYGVQFHPESVMSEGGHRMLANWLGICGFQPTENLVVALETGLATTVGR